MLDTIQAPTNARELPTSVAVRYVPVIRRMALRMARRLPSHVCVDDLVSAGLVGLVEAYRRYDPVRCDRFDAYAEMRIKGAMLDELRSHDPLSRDLRALAHRVAAAARRLEHALGRAPTDEEIAGELGLEVDAYRAYASRMAVGATVSIEANPDDDTRLQIPEPGARADEQLEREQTRAALCNALDELPARLRRVLVLYYRDEITLREIGQLFGVTESRICQIHGDAMQRVRALYALRDGEAARVSHLPPPPPPSSSDTRAPAQRTARTRAA